MPELRERILVMGSPGTGKTYQALTVARRYPGRRFFWIDTDDAVARTLATEFPEVENVEPYTCFVWTDLVKAVESIADEAGPADVVVVDMLEAAWDYVQKWFVEQIHGVSMDQYFLKARKAMKDSARSLDAFDGWTDWTVIKSAYNAWFTMLLQRVSAHVYATAGPKEVGSDDSKELKALFGSYGVRPGGEKHAAHSFHTVLILTHPKLNDWTVTTVKDRGRERFDRQPITDFSLQYMARVCEWRPKKKATKPKAAEPAKPKTTRKKKATS